MKHARFAEISVQTMKEQEVQIQTQQFEEGERHIVVLDQLDLV